jgi:hypothetical protein
MPPPPPPPPPPSPANKPATGFDPKAAAVKMKKVSTLLASLSNTLKAGEGKGIKNSIVQATGFTKTSPEVFLKQFSDYFDDAASALGQKDPKIYRQYTQMIILYIGYLAGLQRSQGTYANVKKAIGPGGANLKDNNIKYILKYTGILALLDSNQLETILATVTETR